MEISMLHWTIDKDTQEQIGVLVQADNGDTQYLTKAEYEQFLKNREKK